MKHREHPAFNANKRLLQFYLDSYLGGDAYITPEHLIMFRLETDTSFQARLQRSYYRNFCDTVVQAYTQNVCGKNTSRKGITDADLYEKFKDDVTGDSTSIVTFFSEVSSYSSACGYSGVLVDGTKNIQNQPPIVTAAYTRAIAPVLRHIFATNLVDWSMDGTGQYNWVLIRTLCYDDKDPEEARKSYWLYELWTKEDVKYYRAPVDNLPSLFRTQKQINVDSEVDLVPDEGNTRIEHNLGVVPFVRFAHSRKLLDGIPAGLLKEISLVNKNIYNQDSCIDVMIHEQTFAQLTMPDDGESTTSGVEKVVGTSRVLIFNPMSNLGPHYIAPPNGPIEIIMKKSDSLVVDIFRMALLQSSSQGGTEVYSTAYKTMTDYKDTEVALAEKAQLMETAEEDVAWIVNLWRNKKDLFWQPRYPRQFDVKALAQELAEAMQLDSLGMGPLYMSTLKKRLVKKSMPELDTVQQTAIDADIDKAQKEAEDQEKQFKEDQQNISDKLGLVKTPEKPRTNNA